MAMQILHVRDVISGPALPLEGIWNVFSASATQHRADPARIGVQTETRAQISLIGVGRAYSSVIVDDPPTYVQLSPEPSLSSTCTMPAEPRRTGRMSSVDFWSISVSCKALDPGMRKRGLSPTGPPSELIRG